MVFDEDLNEGSVAYIMSRRKEMWQVPQRQNHRIWACKNRMWAVRTPGRAWVSGLVN